MNTTTPSVAQSTDDRAVFRHRADSESQTKISMSPPVAARAIPSSGTSAAASDERSPSKPLGKASAAEVVIYRIEYALKVSRAALRLCDRRGDGGREDF